MQSLKSIIFSITVVYSCFSYGEPNLQFLSKDAASEYLSGSDEFISSLSMFDMSARMKTDQVINKEKFLIFVADSTLDWSEYEKTKVTKAYSDIKTELLKRNILLPSDISIILTNGKEEGNAAYTRGNAIILQRDKLSTKTELQRIIAHEMFHIYTRNNHSIKNNLYEIIGFHPVDEFIFPRALSHRKITNPDAPLNNYAIKVEHNDEKLWVAPILFSATNAYIPTKGGEFFDYLQFKLLVLADGNENKLYNPDRPRILDLSQVTGYFEQVGKNTNYIIHPEEILADNFALIMSGRINVQSPEIIEGIEHVIHQSSLNKSMHRTAQSAAR